MKKYVGVLAPVILLTSFGCSSSDEAAKTEASAIPAVYRMNGMEQHSSATFADWKGEADAIALVEVSAERRIDHPRERTTAEVFPVDRDVTIEVKDLYWSRDGYKLPGNFVMSSFGWMRDREGIEVPIAMPDASRFEVGHQYFVAFDRAGNNPADGSQAHAEGWTTLGSYAALPADGAIGVGEREGQVQKEPAKRDPDSEVVSTALASLAPDEAWAVVKERFAQLNR